MERKLANLFKTKNYIEVANSDDSTLDWTFHSKYCEAKHVSFAKSASKFEFLALFNLEDVVVEKVVNITNMKIEENKKKVLIFNLLNYPESKSVFASHCESKNISHVYTKIGSQSTTCLKINHENFLGNVEKISLSCKEQIEQPTNYLNVASFYHVWGVDLNHDKEMESKLKIRENCLSPINVTFINGCMTVHAPSFVAMEEEYKVLPYTSLIEQEYLIDLCKPTLTNITCYEGSPTLSYYGSLISLGMFTIILPYDEFKDFSKFLMVEKIIFKHFMQSGRFTLFSFIDVISNLGLRSNNVILPAKYVQLVNYIKSLQDNLEIYVRNLSDYITSLYLNIFEKDLSDEFYGLNLPEFISKESFDKINSYDVYIVIFASNLMQMQSDCSFSPEVAKYILQIISTFGAKILVDPEFKLNFSKLVIEAILTNMPQIEDMYDKYPNNLGNMLIKLYISFPFPINLVISFKKYEIDDSTIIKSEDEFNYLKIIMAKTLKRFSKTNCKTTIRLLLANLQENIDTNTSKIVNLLEIVWLLFREKKLSNVQYLPIIIDMLMR